LCGGDRVDGEPKRARQKRVEQAEKSLAKFGGDGLERFRAWVKRFGEPPMVLAAT